MKKFIFVLFLCCCAGVAYYVKNGSGNFNNIDWETVSAGKLKILIVLGADVNARNTNGTTPLMLAAARNQNPAVIETLIESGADVNARDQNGRTPLMWAKKYNKNNAILELLTKATIQNAGYAGQ